jgi:hypothetical protein
LIEQSVIPAQAGIQIAVMGSHLRGNHRSIILELPEHQTQSLASA